MIDDHAVYKTAKARPWLYISGPMIGRPGDQGPWMNCRQGILAASLAWERGWHPLCPMLSCLWEMVAGPLDDGSPDGANGWMVYDISTLTRCEALLRLPGASSGADREVEVMLEAGKLVIEVDCDLELPLACELLQLVDGRWEQL